MAFKTRKFSSMLHMDTFLNGGIICGNNKAVQGIEGLVGKTLTFTAPAGAVTFAAVPGRNNPNKLLVEDIHAQIAAVPALGDVVVFAVDGCVAFGRSTPGQVVALSAGPEDSRPLLGLSRSGAVSGVVHNPPTTVPYVFWMHETNGAWVVCTVE